MVASLTPTCVWRVTPELITHLDRQLGDPLDAYVNGSQVWLREDGPNQEMVEWRLHPVPGYERPAGMATEDVFPSTALALARTAEPPAPLDHLWDGLEAFCAYGDDVEPARLATACTLVLGVEPDAVGVADHQRIGDEWEASQRRISIVEALLEELSRPPS